MCLAASLAAQTRLSGVRPRITVYRWALELFILLFRVPGIRDHDHVCCLSLTTTMNEGSLMLFPAHTDDSRVSFCNDASMLSICTVSLIPPPCMFGHVYCLIYILCFGSLGFQCTWWRNSEDHPTILTTVGFLALKEFPLSRSWSRDMKSTLMVERTQRRACMPQLFGLSETPHLNDPSWHRS